MPPLRSISSRRGPFLRDERIQLVVSPDKLVGPALLLAAAGVKEVHLHIRIFRFLRPGFIDLLYRLKGQDDIADLVCFSVPDQFHFTLGVKKENTVFVGLGFARF